jgi:hypothetical protein
VRELEDRAPRSPALFVGREDELRLFAAQSERLRLFVIYGIGGVGKTSFLLRAAEELAARAGAKVAYHIARPGETLRTLAETALAQLGIDHRSANPVAALLARARTAPVALCLDDAHRLDDGRLIDDLVHLALRREPLWLILASREALPISPPAIDHLVVRLAGLGGAPARTLWTALEELYGPSPAAAAELERALASGSVPPLLIKQAFTGPRASARDAIGLGVMPPLDAELLAELCAHRLPVPAQALRAARDPDAVEDALRRLQRRFLVDDLAGGLRAHDVVRETVARSPQAPGSREHERCLAWYRGRDATDGRFELEVLHHALGCGRDDLALAIDGEPVILCLREKEGRWAPRHAIRLDWRDGRVARIRDYADVPYLFADARVQTEETP